MRTQERGTSYSGWTKTVESVNDMVMWTFTEVSLLATLSSHECRTRLASR